MLCLLRYCSPRGNGPPSALGGTVAGQLLCCVFKSTEYTSSDRRYNTFCAFVFVFPLFSLLSFFTPPACLWGKEWEGVDQGEPISGRAYGEAANPAAFGRQRKRGKNQLLLLLDRLIGNIEACSHATSAQEVQRLTSISDPSSWLASLIQDSEHCLRIRCKSLYSRPLPSCLSWIFWTVFAQLPAASVWVWVCVVLWNEEYTVVLFSFAP